MRTMLASAAALVLLTGCTASVTVGADSSDSAGPSAPSESVSSAPGESPAGSPEAAAQPSLGPGFTLVSGDMGSPGTNGFSAVAGSADLVAATTYVYQDEDLNAGLATSNDAGMTWQYHEPLDLPDTQRFGDLLITDQGIILVGVTSRERKGGRSIDEALIAVAPAPDYAIEVVPTPKEFAGDVELAAVFADGTDWVIIGTTAKPEAKGSEGTDEIPTVWRSPDEGSTWTRRVVEVEGSSDTPLYGFVLGPDGSWNLFGQSHSDRGDGQFDAAWLQSTDGGVTFRLMYPDQMTRDHDQGATGLTFSTDGAVAIVGWDEVVEDGDDISVLWAAPAGSPVTAVGQPEIPVQGGTPGGDFADGVMWDNETLVLWGSSDGAYPMPEVQFWGFDGSTFVPTTTLPGEGQLIAVQRILSNPQVSLLFGTTGDTEQRDLAIWAGPLAPQ